MGSVQPELQRRYRCWDQRPAGGGRETEPAQSCSRLGKGGGHAGSVHQRARWRRESLRSVPHACPASLFSPAPGPGGRGRGGPAPLTHHLQPPSRARSKSQDFEPGRPREGRGGGTWGSAAWPGAGPQPLPVSAAAGGRAGDPQPAAVAWPR